MAKTKPEPKTWTHPQWGRFDWDGYSWRGQVAAPGFDVFVYETGYGKPNPPNGMYELRFQTGENAAEPTGEAVALAERIVAQSDATATLIAETLWNDFAGNPPDSGMWWHGDLESVSEDIEPPPTSANGIAALMRLQGISIHQHGDKPVAELNFWAEFEPEHGVGVLTDGETVLGTGYSYDVSPYGSLDNEGDEEPE